MATRPISTHPFVLYSPCRPPGSCTNTPCMAETPGCFCSKAPKQAEVPQARLRSHSSPHCKDEISPSSPNQPYVETGNSGWTGSLIASGSPSAPRLVLLADPVTFGLLVCTGELCCPGMHSTSCQAGPVSKQPPPVKQTHGCTSRATRLMGDAQKYTGLLLLFP